MRLLVFLAALGLSACGGDGDGLAGPAPATQPTATPTPDPGTLATPGTSTGPTTITLIDAEPPPGSTISGCGPDLDGCPERVRVRVRLVSSAAGTVLEVVGFLHGSNKAACFSGAAEGFPFGANETRDVEIVFDTPDLDACTPPAAITHMAIVVGGTIEVASRQEWAVEYRFDR
jgi:hypothetical protein